MSVSIRDTMAKPVLPSEVVAAILRASGPPYAHVRLACKDVRDVIDLGTEELFLSRAGNADDGKLSAFLSRFPNVKIVKTTRDFVAVGSLVALVGLKHLDLSFTKVFDIGSLAGLVGLKHLDMSFTEVVDVGPLAGLVGLEELDLRSTKVDDVGPLAGLVETEVIAT